MENNTKIEFETFRNVLDNYTVNSLKMELPSAVNFVSYRKYKISIELIEESNEMLIERLTKMLNETTNWHVKSNINAEINKLKKNYENI